MLKRAQIVMDDQQQRALRALATRRGVSMSRALREILDAALNSDDIRQARTEFAGFIGGKRGKGADPDNDLYGSPVEAFKKRRRP